MRTKIKRSIHLQVSVCVPTYTAKRLQNIVALFEIAKRCRHLHNKLMVFTVNNTLSAYNTIYNYVTHVRVE